MNDIIEIEKILWIEKRFGITKTIGDNPSNDKVEQTENELLGLLSKYREQLRITIPIPKIRTWLTDDKLNFMFFDRKSGKRILLGTWLSNKETPYER
jgi:hypothetical protein